MSDDESKKTGSAISRVINRTEPRSIRSTIHRHWQDIESQILAGAFVVAVNGTIVYKDQFGDKMVSKGDTVTVTPIAVGG